MIELGDNQYEFNQVTVGHDSVRVSTFKNEYRKNKKLSCYACGIVADKVTIDVFANQVSDQKPHFNFWAGDVLMTHDHQLARSLGGKDVEENARVCCVECNQKKAKPEVKLFDFCKKNNIDPKDLTSGIDWNKLSYQEAMEMLRKIYSKASSSTTVAQTEKTWGEMLYDKIYNDVKG